MILYIRDSKDCQNHLKLKLLSESGRIQKENIKISSLLIHKYIRCWEIN